MVDDMGGFKDKAIDELNEKMRLGLIDENGKIIKVLAQNVTWKESRNVLELFDFLRKKIQPKNFTLKKQKIK